MAETVDVPGVVKVIAADPSVGAKMATGPDQTLAPNTTSEDDRHSLGQRRINIIWEATQAAIAITVTLSMIYAALEGRESQRLGDAFTLIIALYFVRTNHTKIGGVGAQDHR